MAPRETENNAYAKFCGDEQRALWYVMVFSGVVNNGNALETTETAITNKIGEKLIKESTIHSIEQPSQWPTLDTPTFIGLGGGGGEGGRG